MGLLLDGEGFGEVLKEWRRDGCWDVIQVCCSWVAGLLAWMLPTGCGTGR